MMNPLEFDVAGDDRPLQVALSEFDVLVQGDERDNRGLPIQREARDGNISRCAGRVGLVQWSMRSGSTVVDRLIDAKDRFVIVRPSDVVQMPLWHELPGWVSANAAGLHLLVDLTSLSGGAIFQIHSAARSAGNVRVSYAYTSPKSYPQVARPDDVPPVVTRTIKQPYGYRSFAQEHQRGGQREHVILLGFDRHRPNKFIEHYQWPLDHVTVILGDPAYVEGGVQQAEKSLGSVYIELKRLDRVRRINPKLIYSSDTAVGIVNALQELGNTVNGMDIVPLGPKPSLLGSAIYWHSLSAEMQERTRILYDFPYSRRVRTLGVGSVWIYRNLIVPTL